MTNERGRYRIVQMLTWGALVIDVTNHDLASPVLYIDEETVDKDFGGVVAVAETQLTLDDLLDKV